MNKNEEIIKIFDEMFADQIERVLGGCNPPIDEIEGEKNTFKEKTKRLLKWGIKTLVVTLDLTNEDEKVIKEFMKENDLLTLMEFVIYCAEEIIEQIIDFKSQE